MCARCLAARSRDLSYFVDHFALQPQCCLGYLLGSSSAVSARPEFHLAGSTCVHQPQARQDEALLTGVVQQLLGVSVTIGVACGLSFLALSLEPRFFTFSNPFRAVVSFVFCGYSCLKYTDFSSGW